MTLYMASPCVVTAGHLTAKVRSLSPARSPEPEPVLVLPAGGSQVAAPPIRFIDKHKQSFQQFC